MLLQNPRRELRLIAALLNLPYAENRPALHVRTPHIYYFHTNIALYKHSISHLDTRFLLIQLFTSIVLAIMILLKPSIKLQSRMRVHELNPIVLNYPFVERPEPCKW